MQNEGVAPSLACCLVCIQLTATATSHQQAKLLSDEPTVTPRSWSSRVTAYLLSYHKLSMQKHDKLDYLEELLVLGASCCNNMSSTHL